jgi:hypothetical protein
MNRRDFLKAGATGVLGAGGTPAEAAAKPIFDPDSVETHLERIDRRIAWLNQAPLTPRAAKSPEEARLFAERSRLARSAFRTFYFTGAFLNMPEETQMHPGVQERIARMQPDMDFAVNGVADMLENLHQDERKVIQKELRDQPELGRQIGGMFHTIAQEDGFQLTPRLDIRLAFADMTQRLKTQNPSLLIDPCLKKVRAIQANAERDAQREREATSKKAAGAFWELEQRLAGHVREWDRIYSVRPRTDLTRLESIYPGGPWLAQAEPVKSANDAAPLSPPPPPPPEEARETPEPPPGEESAETPGPPPNRPPALEPHPDERVESQDRAQRPRETMATGGKIMGFGLGSVALGGVFYALAAVAGTGSGVGSVLVWPALVFGVTVGPILLAIGLIVVIVGGIWYLSVAP